MQWRSSSVRAALRPLSSLFYQSHHPHPHLHTLVPKNPITTTRFHRPTTPFRSRPFSSLLSDTPPPPLLKPNNTSDDDANTDADDLVAPEPTKNLSIDLLRDIETVVSSLRDFTADGAAAKRRLENCGVSLSPDLIPEVLSHLRNDWAAAFTFFLWAGEHPGHSHSLRDYHSMISILGKLRRFDTAWNLVEEMRMHKPSLVTPQTLLILIRRYAAVHDVGRAINAFYAFKRFGLKPGIEDFHGLLSALCRYKNVGDAEHLLLCNERTFPFETKSFNIVLNGWCNVVVRLQEAKRFWKAMANRGIEKDVVSYGSMISCYSKAGSLHDVLKLFNRMKEAGIVPDRKVYNAVVYALAKGRCVEEARGLVKTMEEKGIAPDAVTFNSLIRPLCKARRNEDAREVFDDMLRRGLTPSIRTYHAFLDVSRTPEEVFEMMNQMKETGCSAVNETYIMLIRKLSRWRQHESVYRLWNEMLANGMSHDRSAYIVLIHGLFLNGKLEEASRYYEEMKAKGFEPEPKTEEMIQAWILGKQASRSYEELDGNTAAVAPLNKKPRGASNTSLPRRAFLKPETRIVKRERGFSLG